MLVRMSSADYRHHFADEVGMNGHPCVRRDKTALKFFREFSGDFRYRYQCRHNPITDGRKRFSKDHLLWFPTAASSMRLCLCLRSPLHR